MKGLLIGKTAVRRGPGMVMLWAVLILILAACTGTADTPTVEPTAAVTVAPSTTAVPVATTLTSSATPTSSQTPRPTKTPTPAPPIRTPVPAPPTVVAPPLSGEVPPPAGLIYRTGDGLWQVNAGGRSALLTAQSGAVPAPDGQHAIRRDDDGVVWLLDTAGGAERSLELDGLPVGIFTWLDADRVLIGFWRNQEDEGPNAGRLGLYDIVSDSFTDLDTGLTGAPPAVSPDGQSFVYSDFDGRYRFIVGEGAEPFDPSSFSGFPSGETRYYGAASWSPDGRLLAWPVGVQFGENGEWPTNIFIFDWLKRTVSIIYSFESVGFGGWLPAPVWSPDGEWLALPVFAQEPNDAGIWVIPTDGSESHQVFPSASVSGLVWAGRRLLFTNLQDRPDGEVRLVVVENWQQYRVELPAGATTVSMAGSTGGLVLAEERSPDGNWWVRYGLSDPVPAAEDEHDLFPGEKYQVQLRVGRVGSNQSWSVVDEWRNYGLGFDWPAPLRWSADGRALYYTNYPVPDGCAIFVNGSDLWRVDLETGATTQLLPFTGLTLAALPGRKDCSVLQLWQWGPATSGPA